MKETGISHLAFTPHFYASEQSLSSFLEQRAFAWEAVQALPEAEGMHFTLGAEVYLTEDVLNIENLKPLCYANTDFMLTELETLDRFTPAMERRLIYLTVEHGLTPVLAHIDRYPFLIRDFELLLHLRDMGCLFQVNLDSFSYFFLRRRLVRLAKCGMVHLFGQDVHEFPVTGKERAKLLSVLERKCPGLMAVANAFACSEIFVS
jgi:protein-tyrosine phosphatase